jgi:NAD(P)H-nitrite reductase large subunit
MMMPHSFDIVIIGNSAAGLQAMRTIRRHSRLVSVAVIDREEAPAYSRVLTPYYVGGKTTRENLFIVEEEFYRKMGVTPLFGKAAVGIDPDRHEITLEDGMVIRFGKLLIAAGAEARQLPTSSGRVCILRHMADADRLRGLLEGARSITAVGAGLVSVPCLSHAGTEVEKHLVVGSDRVFSRVVDTETAEVLAEHFRAAGVFLHLRNDVVEMKEGERLELTLASGTVIQSDLLIVGKGVVPNTAFAREAGLMVGEGIIIDERCRTSRPDIYAAGDVAEGPDFVTGEKTVQGNWVTAVEQGEAAALNMLGLPCSYEGSLKNNITEVFGMEVAAVGYCRDDAPRSVSTRNALGGRFRKVFLDKKDRIIGAALVGETNDAGVWYQMIRTRTVFPGPALLQGTASHAALISRQ